MNTPRFEYSISKMNERIKEVVSLSAPFGFVPRYAMKANNHPRIIAAMHEHGIHFDASSSYEAAELLALGIPGHHISLSSQQSPHNLPELLAADVRFVATSKKQLALFLNTPDRPNTVGVRINPDLGFGHNNRTSTGGTAASFGIWHEYIPDLLQQTTEAEVKIDRLHVHVGSGADPKVWGEVMDRALELVRLFSDVTSLDIGGGYKVHRYGEEKETDIASVVAVFGDRVRTFATETGRELALEIEPGTFLIAHAGTLVATIDDIVDTGTNGHTFLRLNTGMNDFLRSAMYGARHTIEVVNGSDKKRSYVVVGHNCESGDIFTPQAGDPEGIEERLLNEASIGDEVRIYDMGAYCASMRAKGYNSFPAADEAFIE